MEAVDSRERTAVEWGFYAALAVVATVWALGLSADVLGVGSLAPVSQLAGAAGWVLLGVWLVGIRASPGQWWAVVGGLGAAGVGLVLAAGHWFPRYDFVHDLQAIAFLVVAVALLYDLNRR